MRDCVIVIGMHRSGTSALAGTLHRLGADFGADLIAAQDDNVRGYYEHRRILELHEDLLAAHGSSWDDPAPRDWALEADPGLAAVFQDDLETVLRNSFAERELWAVKDPRLSHLLPLWLPVLASLGTKPRVVLACRSPSEVASSLARREGFSREKSGILWLQHTLAAERTSRPFPRAFVDFPDLLRDPVATLNRVGRQLDLDWPLAPAVASAEIDAFLDPGLRHQNAAGDDLEGRWGRAAGRMPALVEALRHAVEEPANLAIFDAIAAQGAATSGVDPLLVEHLHEFGRREARREAWSAGQSIQQQLAATSERLGSGLGRNERQLAAVAERLRSIEDELDRRSRAGEERRAGVDRTLDHLTKALTTAEIGIRHLEGQDADLRAKIARWGDEVDIESKLTTLEEKLARLGDEVDVESQLARLERKLTTADAALSFLSDRADAVDSRTAGLAATVSAMERSWWRRLERRLRRLLGRP